MNQPSAFDPLPDHAPAARHGVHGERRVDGSLAAEHGPGEPAGHLPNSELALVWERVRRSLQERIRPEQFHTWFKQAELRSIGDGADTTVTIAVQNNFTSFFIKTYYMEQLADALRDALGGPRPVDLLVDAGLSRGEGLENDRALESAPLDGQPAPLPAPHGAQNGSFGGSLHGSLEGGDGRADALRPQADLFRTQDPVGRGAGGGLHGEGAQHGGAQHGGAQHGGAQQSGAQQAGAGHGASSRGLVDRSMLEREALERDSIGRDAQKRPRDTFGDPALEQPRGRLLSASDVGLNPTYRFENFVVGPCNRFAHAASVGVSEGPGQTYNPLFLHGNVGLGKTHLIQSLCHSILVRDPGTRILYLSCESFVNHFVDALDKGDLQRFRNKYRNVDVLVVDDIHLLANKERTQEEFFHTFNTLYNAGKQIVLSSDSPPKDIPTLQNRLVSRFKWGLVTEIETPCYETRRAILKRKSREKGNELPDDVASDLAEAITANIRELEGAVTRLLGYAALSNQPVTVALARECLRDLFEHATSQPNIDDVLRVVTSHFQIRLVDLQSRKRTHAIAFARQVGMYLARKLTRLSLQEIGGHFGGRDHSTVLYAVERIKEGMQKDAEILETVRRVESALAAR
ncbi:Chromosomal replication initiator protein DnaA [Planctomycetes bacterium Pla163]|uniref:Chromosomal replication initiator protein DnaA n=1 Tax=Rohdeia mirabilis TaxID=2528008 RepID=A0A518CUK5_9BACT|nr:Chromosomal replication initiator protein DnaA [Planctomycetes bacterium Pla163]